MKKDGGNHDQMFRYVTLNTWCVREERGKVLILSSRSQWCGKLSFWGRTCFDANERKMNHCVLASSYFSISCSSRWPFIAQHTSLTEAKSVLARSNSSIIGHFLAFFPSQWTKPSLLLCLFFIRAVLHLIATQGAEV